VGPLDKPSPLGAQSTSWRPAPQTTQGAKAAESPVQHAQLYIPLRTKMINTVGFPTPAERSEAELSIHIRKATNPDETAPKRKHVRAAIVYTWDHKSSQSFWSALKV
jgi:hypothetical protein